MFLSMGSNIIGREAIFYKEAPPPPPPNFQVLPSTQVDQSKTSGAGAYGRADSQGRPARHLLEASREAVRWAASEGSLSLTVAGSLSNECIRRGSGGRGDHEREGKGSGVGSKHLLESNKEGIRRHDLEGGGGGRRSRVGGRRKINAAGTTDGSRVESNNTTE